MLLGMMVVLGEDQRELKQVLIMELIGQVKLGVLSCEVGRHWG